ncbi:MAG TPA: hypothetical protein VF274_02575 [Alphaproteobacteria bacterium]|jgi:hypothetical protein
MTPTADAPRRHDTADLVVPVSDVLLASLAALADAGQADAACRLAGRAYVLLRRPQPDVARRFDALLHRLAPRLTWSEPPEAHDPRPRSRRPS